jgi:hypothetical protein
MHGYAHQCGHVSIDQLVTLSVAESAAKDRPRRVHRQSERNCRQHVSTAQHLLATPGTMSWVGSIVARMTAQPLDPAAGPDVGSYDLIHLGDQAAVVVPLADFLKLRALEQHASAEELEDAEDAAAVQEWQARQAAGHASYVPAAEVRQRLGLER